MIGLLLASVVEPASDRQSVMNQKIVFDFVEMDDEKSLLIKCCQNSTILLTILNYIYIGNIA